mgnify:CR=1 FL=1
MSAGEAGLAAPAGQAASGGFDGIRPSVPAAPERPAGALSRESADIPFSIKPNLIYSKESFDYDFPL